MSESRRLIICCDGTWNSAEQDHDGVPTPTNVRLFHNVLATHGRDGRKQVARYFSGVGADGSLISRAIDGGIGRGLSANIRNAYLWLASNYEEGDTLCLVGFSRGAFTVRSLIGMIRAAGLLDLHHGVGGSASDRSDAVKAAFARYRDPARSAWPGRHCFHRGFGPDSREERDRMPPGTFIEFLGVWDTVGALGVPDSLAVLNRLDDPERYRFHNMELAPEVGAARHAMALDERRGPFVPAPWERMVGELCEQLPNDERVTQLWFPGVHSDVGGGYAEHGLSDGALRWMIDEAVASTPLGVRWQAVDQLRPDALDVLHDSCTNFYEWTSSAPRPVPRVDSDARVHRTARTRLFSGPIRQDPYRRTVGVIGGDDGATCEVLARTAWSETGLWLEEGTYTFTARGDWNDGENAVGPTGVVDESVLRGVRSLVGRAEQWWNGRDGVAQFTGTKRCEEANWMELIGVVANDAGELAAAEDSDLTMRGPDGHQWVRIGAEARDVPIVKEGYLYAFANDAWGFYGNNRGSVRLTVTRVDAESSSLEVPASEQPAASSP